MKEPVVYLAYTPRGAGLLCAVVLTTDESNVYGWYTGAKGNEFPASFFMLENFYSIRESAFYHTVADDVYDDWVIAYPPLETKLDRPVPVPEEMCHALARMQDVFAEDWLFYADSPYAEGESKAYAQQKLPVQSVNIKNKKLNKLDKKDVVWNYASPGLDMNIIEFLRSRWPLDYSA